MTNNYRSFFTAFVIVLLGSFSPYLFGSEIICAENWEALDAENLSTEDVLDKWLDIDNACKETGYFYLRLGNLYSSLKDLPKAQTAYEKASTYDSALERGIEMALANVHYQQALLGYGDPVEHTKIAEKIFLSLIEKYPEYYGAYIQYSFLLLSAGRYDEVIRNAERGVSIKPFGAGYRNLVIAYCELGQYQKSVSSFEKAYMTYEGLTSDRNSMLCAALSYARTGDTQMAKGLLVELTENRPEIIEDQFFIKVLDLVKAEIDENGQ